MKHIQHYYIHRVGLHEHTRKAVVQLEDIFMPPTTCARNSRTEVTHYKDPVNREGMKGAVFPLSNRRAGPAVGIIDMINSWTALWWMTNQVQQ